MKLPQGALKIVSWVIPPWRCLWVPGELQASYTPQHPILSWKGCWLFFPPVYLLQHKGRAPHALILIIRDGVFCTHSFLLPKRTGVFLVFVLEKYFMSSPVVFFLGLDLLYFPWRCACRFINVWNLMNWFNWFEPLFRRTLSFRYFLSVKHRQKSYSTVSQRLFFCPLCIWNQPLQAHLIFLFHVVSDNWVSQQSRALFFML